MSEIARALRAAVEENEDFDLRAVSRSDLRAAVGVLSYGPAGARAFAWFLAHPDQEVAGPAALDVVKETEDPGVLIEIVAWLGRGAEIPQSLRRPLWQALMDRAQDRKSHYGVRAHSLYGALLLSQRDPPLLRGLEGALLDVDPADDGRYLRHAARIIGAVLSHRPDPDLRRVLVTVGACDEARDEAAMELGLDDLRTALDATDADTAVAGLRSAVARFEEACAVGDGRPDAELYRQSVTMLLSFQAGGDGSDLPARIEGLRAAASNQAAYLSLSDRPADTSSWLGSAPRERTHWGLLGLRLGALDLSLGKRAWLNAASIIEDELLAVYTASRTFLTRDADGGVEAVLRPRIEGALQRERARLDCLDQWVEENAGAAWMRDAVALREEVAAARERVVTRHPEGATTGSPAVVAILDKGLIPEGRRAEILARIEEVDRAVTMETTTPMFQELFARLTDAMSENSDYAGNRDAALLYDALALAVLRYAVCRHDVGRASQPSVAYLFERDPQKLPLEKDLQIDFHQFLLGGPLASVCQAEVRDIGGGRVDVLFTMSRLRTVTELKKIDAVHDDERVVNDYGLQTASYQTTDVTFGFLLVLDLADRNGGQPHIREQIGVYRRTPDWGSTEYFITLVRIQGRRKRPSDL